MSDTGTSAVICHIGGQIFRIGTVRYAEGLWRMRRHGPVIAHCTDSEDFPIGDERATALWYPMRLNCSVGFTTSQWLQPSATQHSTFCARGSNKMSLHGGTTVWGGTSSWSLGISQLSLPTHSAIRRRHDERENNEINRLDKLGNTSHPRRRHRWWSLD